MKFRETHEERDRRYKELGDRREIRFAWLPVRLEDGRFVWLEKYLIEHDSYYWFGEKPKIKRKTAI